MNSIKIIAGFFNKTTSKKEIAYQRKMAKQNKKAIEEIQAEDAYLLYHSNPWFRSKISAFGKPEPGQLVVVIYYKSAGAAHPKNIEPKKKNKMITKKQGTMLEKTKTKKAVKAEPRPLKKVYMFRVSPEAGKARTRIIELGKANNTRIIKHTPRAIEFYSFYDLRSIA